jgi:hypothetical protein
MMRPMSADERRETKASRRSRDPERDPRDIVTEYAFQVDPDLLGVPLAGPFRRLAAMLIDLCVLGLLFPFRAAASALMGGTVDLLVALAMAWVLFRLASPSSAGRTPGGVARFVLRSAGVVVALVGLGTFAGDLSDGDGGSDPPAAVAGLDTLGAGAADDADPADGPAREALRSAAGGGERADELRRALAEAGGVARGGDGPVLTDLGIVFSDVTGGIRDYVALTRADDAEAAQPAADRMALGLHRLGASTAETRTALREVIREAKGEEPAWADSVVARATARADSAARVERMELDSLVVAYARAVTEGDTAGTGPLRDRLRDAVAGDRIEALEERNERLEDRLEEAEESPGLLRRARTLVTEDLGIGLGWLGLYFTIFVALWDGRTPGKKLAGARIVNLDGEPLGWWDAFGRFGGYAAGLATGMLGYLQIAWDPNRQALHDRVAGTVVIRTRGPGKRYRPDDGA